MPLYYRDRYSLRDRLELLLVEKEAAERNGEATAAEVDAGRKAREALNESYERAVKVE